MIQNNHDQNRRNIIQKTLSTTTGLVLTYFSTASLPSNAERPTYLTDPTEDFKQSEKQREEFKKAQREIKVKFSAIIDRLANESNTEEALVKDLNQLEELVTATGGLPLGIKKEEMYKTIRRKKKEGFWPTNVEIAYQALIREISYQQNPNVARDSLSPL